MIISPRISRYYLAFSYIAVSLLPFFSCLLGKFPDQPLRLICYEVLSWCMLWAIFKSPRWFHFLLLPAFFAIPIEVYLQVFYGQGISTHHLGIIAETSPKEALEFLGTKIWLLLFIIFFISGWWYSLLRAAKQNIQLGWTHRSRWYALVIMSLLSSVWFYGQEVGIASESTSISAKTSSATSSASDELENSSSAVSTVASIAMETDTKTSASMSNSIWSIRSWSELETFIENQAPLPHWAEFFYDTESFSRSWPLGIFARGADFYLERSYLSKLSEKSSDFSFHAQQAAGNDFQQTIVLVIGESSRFDRWSINGYERLTNPYLSQEENLVSFTDMITGVAATRLSVPIIATRKPMAQSLKAGFGEKSFLSAFKEAGFKTFWLSNQMSFGQFDTPTSVIAKEADVTQFLNLGGFTNKSSFDQILLNPLQKAIDDTAPNKLIVLHTLGNHWNYSQRHPKEYDQWKPSLFGVSNPAYTDLKNKEALNNSYDNSILYTDWMLARVIAQLKMLSHMTALMYVSDHGQTLYDGTCRLAFHGHNTQYEFHIPAFAWYSDQYAAQHPEKISQLRAHKNAKLTTENVFHSLLDMVDIRYPDEHLEKSIFSARLKPHLRYVDSYGWSNYDDASFKGDCREVIDNKTPLEQEK
jgi:glucan phosphoethanolaminetransferase (alkaline phosphatase superfamily)